MPLDHAALMARPAEERRHAYTDTQMLLYNLGIGMGRDPFDPHERPFVFEQPSLRVVPSAATVLDSGGTALLDGIDIDWPRVVHGEQRLTIHRPLAPSGRFISRSHISELIDKGADKGAVLTVTREARLESGEPLFSTDTVMFARGSGGFGGPAAAARSPHILPDRAPDIVDVFETRPDQALLYRLNGDRNPLHADPAFAARVGFPAPILHGLCSYGIACRAVLASVCAHDPARMKSFDARFSAPVFPGETVHTDIWVDGGIAAFRSRIASRGVVSVNNGRCRFVA